MQWVARIARIALLAVMAANISSCFMFCAFSPGACEDGTPAAQVAIPVVSVSASPLRMDLVPGSTTTSAVTVSLSGGPSGAALSIGGTLPSGVTATFAPASVSGAGTSTLTLAATTSAVPGLFQFDVVATSTGSSPATIGTTAITGEVLRPFRLSGVNSQTMTVGTSRDIAVAVARATGFTAPIAVAVDPSTLPAGATATFTPAVMSSSSATLALALPANAPTGRYLTRLFASSGASADTVVFLLDVQSAPVPPDFTMSPHRRRRTLRLAERRASRSRSPCRRSDSAPLPSARGRSQPESPRPLPRPA